MITIRDKIQGGGGGKGELVILDYSCPNPGDVTD